MSRWICCYSTWQEWIITQNYFPVRTNLQCNIYSKDNFLAYWDDILILCNHRTVSTKKYLGDDVRGGGMIWFLFAQTAESFQLFLVWRKTGFSQLHISVVLWFIYFLEEIVYLWMEDIFCPIYSSTFSFPPHKKYINYIFPTAIQASVC